MLVLLYKVCNYVIMGNLETSLCVYVCVVVYVICTCNTWPFVNEVFVHVSVVVEGMYKCDTGNFGNEPLCVCYCFCRGYVHM